MAKVTYVFDENEESSDINIVANRHKLICVGYDIQELRRALYKGYIDNIITVKDNKVITEEDRKENNYMPFEDAKCYIEIDRVIDKLDDILDSIYFLLN